MMNFYLRRNDVENEMVFQQILKNIVLNQCRDKVCLLEIPVVGLRYIYVLCIRNDSSSLVVVKKSPEIKIYRVSNGEISLVKRMYLFTRDLENLKTILEFLKEVEESETIKKFLTFLGS